MYVCSCGSGGFLCNPKGGATCFGKHISGERPLKKGENRNRFD